MTPFLVIAFINEEAMGSIYEEAIGTINEAVFSAIIAGRNPPSQFFFISCSTVLLAQSINRPEFSSYSTILIISSISSLDN